MVLESAISDSPDDGGFYNPEDDQPHSSRYPALGPVPTLFGTGIRIISTATETHRELFLERWIRISREQFGFSPTPVEYDALRYYQGTIWNAQAQGAQNWRAGALLITLPFIARSKRPLFIFRIPGNYLNISYQTQLITSKAFLAYVVWKIGGGYGSFYGGLRATIILNRLEERDPNMQRYLLMRREWMRRNGPSILTVLKNAENARKEDAKHQHQVEDAQSLGGLEFYDSGREEAPDEGTSRQPQRPPQPQPEPQVSRAAQDNDDPFDFSAKSRTEDQSRPQGSSARGMSGESAWERIRRGEPRVEAYDEGDARKDVPRSTDQYNENDRETNRERAQKAFDEQVDRERYKAGEDGFVPEREGRTRR